MAWVPTLTRDNGIWPLEPSNATLLESGKPKGEGEEPKASEQLLKTRRVSVNVLSIKYSYDTCAILLNLTFDLRTGQTLKRAKIPLRVVDEQNGVVIDSWDPNDSELIQVDNKAQTSWLHAVFNVVSAFFFGKLNRTAVREKGQAISSYVTQSVLPMGPSTVILNFNGSGALEPPFPTNVHLLLRIKKISPHTSTDRPFAFRLILSNELKVEISRKWLPSQWFRPSTLFRLKKPRGWSILILRDFNRLPADEVVGCGLGDAWARVQGAVTVKGSSNPMREPSVDTGPESVQLAAIQQVSR